MTINSFMPNSLATCSPRQAEARGLWEQWNVAGTGDLSLSGWPTVVDTYAWDEGVHGDTELARESDDPLIDASSEPKMRPRTRLTDEEVDAMRTARANGLNVNTLAKQFGVHRGTVWETRG